MTQDTKYLKQRGGIGGQWYFQRRVPSYIRQYYSGQDALVKPLGTDSLAEARLKRDKILAEMNQLMLVAKGMKGEQTLVSNIKKEFNRMTKAELRHELEMEGDKLTGDFPYLGHPERNYEIHRDPTDEEVLRYNVLAELTGTKPYSEIAEKFRMTLGHACEKLKKSKKHIVAQKTLAKFDRNLDKFNRFVDRDNYPAHEISFHLVSDYINYLRDNFQYKDRYIKDMLSYLNKMWEYVRKSEGLTTVSPFKVSDHDFEKDSRRAWSGKKGYYRAWAELEIIKVFNVAIREASKSKHQLPQHDLLPIFIGWFTGARIDEVYTLTRNDIVMADNILCFDFKNIENYQADGRANFHSKNAYAPRKVPVHNELKPILDHYFNKFDKFPRESTDAYGKWFGKIKKEAGFPERYKAFHSFRSNVITRLAEVHTPTYISNAITGHSSSSLGIGADVYMEQLTPPILNPEIQKLPKFPCEFPSF